MVCGMDGQKLRIVVYLLTIEMAYQSAKAVSTCSKDNFELPNLVTRENYIRSCVADCLDLAPKRRTADPCKYNSTTGKVFGCSPYFKRPSATEKIMMCSQGFPIDANHRNLVACDMMYFNIFSYNSDNTVTTQKLSDQQPYMTLARGLGIKVLGQLNLQDIGGHFQKVVADPELRSEFVESFLEVFDQQQLDGFYFVWRWPGCSISTNDVVNCASSSAVTNSIIAMFHGLAKPIKERGKIFIPLISGSPFVVFQHGDYFSNITKYVDYFVLETNNMIMQNTQSEYSFNLRTTREAFRVFMAKVRDPTVLKKLLMTLDPYVTAFEVRDPKALKIQTLINANSKKYERNLPLRKWCKLIKNDTYKLVRNPEIQHYAVREDHLFLYDDIESLKLKVDWFTTFGTGINLINTFADDAYGECGCGPLPMLRSLAEMLKNTHCDPIPCF